jgi:hypothetical protein
MATAIQDKILASDLKAITSYMTAGGDPVMGVMYEDGHFLDTDPNVDMSICCSLQWLYDNTGYNYEILYKFGRQKSVYKVQCTDDEGAVVKDFAWEDVTAICCDRGTPEDKHIQLVKMIVTSHCVWVLQNK